MKTEEKEKTTQEKKTAQENYELALQYKNINDHANAFSYFKLAADQGHVESQFNTGFYYAEGRGVAKNIKKAITYCELAAKEKHIGAYIKLGRIYETERDNKTEALKYYKLAADEGNSTAQCYLAGVYFQLGELAEDVMTMAVKYYKLSAAQGNAYAQACLMKIYMGGKSGVKKDLKVGLEYGELAVAGEDEVAILMLAEEYMDGKNVTQDLNKAAEFYTLAAAITKKKGNTVSVDSYGNEIGRTREVMYTHYLIAAENSQSADVDDVLGYFYENGIGVEKDIKTAIKHYKSAAKKNHLSAIERLLELDKSGQGNKTYQLTSLEKSGIIDDFSTNLPSLIQAAEKNHITAQIDLATRYFYGKHGVEQDLEKAFQYYLRAANNGNAFALCRVGNMYFCGQGVTKNFEEAFRYYKLSADKGNEKGSAYAQTILASMYFHGQGVKESAENAVKYCNLAVIQKEPEAQRFFGNWCYFGYGVKQDFNEAIKYYQLSADQKDRGAQFCLGYMYEKGLGVEQDFNEAIKYYQLSANNMAQYSLGCLYEKGGEGIEKNIEEAIKYYKLSSEQGNTFAHYALALLYENCKEKTDKDQAEKYFKLFRESEDKINFDDTKKKLINDLNDIIQQQKSFSIVVSDFDAEKLKEEISEMKFENSDRISPPYLLTKKSKLIDSAKTKIDEQIKEHKKKQTAFEKIKKSVLEDLSYIEKNITVFPEFVDFDVQEVKLEVLETWFGDIDAEAFLKKEKELMAVTINKISEHKKEIEKQKSLEAEKQKKDALDFNNQKNSLLSKLLETEKQLKGFDDLLKELDAKTLKSEIDTIGISKKDQFITIEEKLDKLIVKRKEREITNKKSVLDNTKKQLTVFFSKLDKYFLTIENDIPEGVKLKVNKPDPIKLTIKQIESASDLNVLNSMSEKLKQFEVELQKFTKGKLRARLTAIEKNKPQKIPEKFIDQSKIISDFSSEKIGLKINNASAFDVLDAISIEVASVETAIKDIVDDQKKQEADKKKGLSLQAVEFVPKNIPIPKEKNSEKKTEIQSVFSYPIVPTQLFEEINVSEKSDFLKSLDKVGYEVAKPISPVEMGDNDSLLQCMFNQIESFVSQNQTIGSYSSFCQSVNNKNGIDIQEKNDSELLGITLNSWRQETIKDESLGFDITILTEDAEKIKKLNVKTFESLKKQDDSSKKKIVNIPIILLFKNNQYYSVAPQKVERQENIPIKQEVTSLALPKMLAKEVVADWIAKFASQKFSLKEEDKNNWLYHHMLHHQAIQTINTLLEKDNDPLLLSVRHYLAHAGFLADIATLEGILQDLNSETIKWIKLDSKKITEKKWFKNITDSHPLPNDEKFVPKLFASQLSIIQQLLALEKPMSTEIQAVVMTLLEMSLATMGEFSKALPIALKDQLNKRAKTELKFEALPEGWQNQLKNITFLQLCKQIRNDFTHNKENLLQVGKKLIATVAEAIVNFNDLHQSSVQQVSNQEENNLKNKFDAKRGGL